MRLAAAEASLLPAIRSRQRSEPSLRSGNRSARLASHGARVQDDAGDTPISPAPGAVPGGGQAFAQPIAPLRVEPGVISTLMLSMPLAMRIAVSHSLRSYSCVTMPSEVTRPRVSRSIAIG